MVWYAGNRAAHIGRVNPETGDIVRYEMPDPAARDPHTLTFDGRGHIWFTVQHGNFVGRLAMASGEIELVEVPTPNARPYGMAVDHADRIWFVETGPAENRFVGFDPRKEEFVNVTAIPSRAGAVRHMYFHAPQRSIWFGTDTNNIGRAIVPD